MKNLVLIAIAISLTGCAQTMLERALPETDRPCRDPDCAIFEDNEGNEHDICLERDVPDVVIQWNGEWEI